MRAEKMNADDDLAIVRSAEHDRAHFDGLFDRYADRVYRLALRRSTTIREAEALTSRMLTEVFGALGDFDGSVSLDAWVLSRCKAVLARHDARVNASAEPAPDA